MDPAPTIKFLDPTAAAGGDGSIERPFTAWDQVRLQPGDVVLLKGGTTVPGFAVNVQGTADRPVGIGSYGTGQAKIDGMIALGDAQYVNIADLDITGGNDFGVVLAGTTAHSTIRDCAIHGGRAGIVVTGSVGTGNIIAGNRIFENDTIGVWFTSPQACTGAETLVSDNTIYRNGQQGILIQTSHVLVDGNTVVNNGLAGLAGMSGIHVVAGSATAACEDNVISNNIVAWQRDGSSLDGNGIQLDHWSFANRVVGNTIFGNDGCGINLLSTRDCLVADNIVFGNQVDEGGTHVLAKAEIFIGEALFTPGVTTGNIIARNQVQATSPHAVALQVQPLVSARPSNILAANAIGRLGPGDLWIWADRQGSAVEAWNAQRPGGSDTALVGFTPPDIALAPDLLERATTWHSDFYRSVTDEHMAQAVPIAAEPDLFGSAQGSWMAGDGRANVLTAVAGDNQLAAGRGNATLRGGPGRDSLFGGRGDNRIFAGSGDTLIFGGSGSSWLFGGSGDDIIYGGNGSGGHLLQGGEGENTLVATDGADTFVLGYGVDHIFRFDLLRDRLDVSAYGVESVAQLRLGGDSSVTTIGDANGNTHALLVGIDASRAREIAFVLANPPERAVVSIEAGSAPRSEDQGAAAPFTFTLRRSGDTSTTHTVAWTTRPIAGSPAPAADGADFAGRALPAGTVTFLPGEARKDLSIATAADTALEEDESFAVLLTDPSAGLAIGTSLATATIRNDDTRLSLARLQASRSEGQDGTTPFTFLVTRAGRLDRETTATWSVAGGNTPGTLAAQASDFAGNLLPAGRVVFNPGETERIITIDIAGDALREFNESFTLTLANPSAQTAIDRASAVGVIWNDDSPGTGTVAIAAATATLPEGTGGMTPVRFTVTRTGDTSGPARLDWAVANRPATAPVSGRDFGRGVLPSGRIAFAPGETAATITVYVVADPSPERDETFAVTLSGAQAGVTIAAPTATVRILNDDAFVSKPKGETLKGFETPDIFRLGGGIDTITGGGGIDSFVFLQTAIASPIHASTTLTDFNPAAGERLDLSAIDAYACTPENDSFVFLGTAPFSGTRGELRWQPGDGRLLIQGDVTGDAESDLTIWVTGTGPVLQDWFVL